MARKRTIQKGSIFSDRGRLRVKIRVPNALDKNGKPLYKAVSTGLSDTARGRELATAILEKMYLDLYHGIGVEKSANILLVNDAYEQFKSFKTRMKSTLDNYDVVKRAIITGNYPVSKSRLEQDIQDFVNSGKHSKATVNSYLSHIRSFLTYLRDEKGLEVPSNILKRFGKKTKTVIRNFSDEEVDLMLSDHQDPELHDMLIVMLNEGARPVDVLTLKEEQVNLKKNIVTWHNKITKEDEPRPITNATKEALQRRLNLAVNEKVFRWSHASISRVSRHFKELLLRVGVPLNKRSLKHLRTTYKRRLMEKHVPFEVEMYLMRHRKPNVTLDSYTEVTFEQARKYL